MNFSKTYTAINKGDVMKNDYTKKILVGLFVSHFVFLLVGCGDDGSSAKSSDTKSESEILDDSSEYTEDGDWSWDIPKENYLNSEIEYGSMKDSRDGKNYKTIKIGEQTWMAENLNYADSAETPSLKGNSWCYDDKVKNCDLTGRLYRWAAAIDSVKLAKDADNPQSCGYDNSCLLPSIVQGICPEGWHLPSKDDWDILIAAAGGESVAGKALKTKKGYQYCEYVDGNGTDKFGFSGLPAGAYDYERLDEKSLNAGLGADFWSSTQYDAKNAYTMTLIATSDNAYQYEKSTGAGGYSIRCVRD